MNKKKTTLGRSLMKSRFQSGGRMNPDGSFRHTTDLQDGPTWMNMQSVTEENDLDAFLTNATLAGTEFTAGKAFVFGLCVERLNVKVIPINQSANPFLLSPEKEEQVLLKHEMHKDKITVPRRPAWTSETTAEELQKNERESFLIWRRRLALLEEEEELLLTPYERNLEVWRQLWRVIERSDMVVQIVDARNPLLFRSEDLEAYVKEIDAEKKNLLLVNKADLLSKRQRRKWAAYFESRGISFVFFSAALSVQMNEEEKGGSVDKSDSVENTTSTETENTTTITENATITENPPKDPTTILTAMDLIDLFSQLSNTEKVTVGFVGYPNVGKSSTMNALIGAKKVTVSATPGKTKHFQTIHLTDKMMLCDCPGLVFPTFATTKADMVTNGILPIDQLREFTGPSALITQRIPKHVLESMYGIQILVKQPQHPPTAEEFLRAYAVARGFKKAGQGNPDESRAARVILKDYVNGKLLFVHPPPSLDPIAFNKDAYQRMLLAVQRKKGVVIETPSQSSSSTELMTDVTDFLNPTHIEAKTRGKFSTDSFSRVTIYPIHEKQTMVMKETKKHGKGKKEKKRDYWTKDYDY